MIIYLRREADQLDSMATSSNFPFQHVISARGRRGYNHHFVIRSFIPNPILGSPVTCLRVPASTRQFVCNFSSRRTFNLAMSWYFASTWSGGRFSPASKFRVEHLQFYPYPSVLFRPLPRYPGLLYPAQRNDEVTNARVHVA